MSVDKSRGGDQDAATIAVMRNDTSEDDEDNNKQTASARVHRKGPTIHSNAEFLRSIDERAF